MNEKALQQIWFGGYTSFLVCASLYFLNTFLWIPVPFEKRLYFFSLLSLVLCFSTVIYKSYGVPKLTAKYFQDLLLDSNAQYWFLCLALSFQPESFVALIPLYIYSIYHVLGYLGSKAPFVTVLFSVQPQALSIAARFEIYALLHLTWIWLMGRGSLIMIVTYMQFLRFQYIVSTKTRIAFQQFRIQLDQLTAHPKCPSIIRIVYEKIRELVSKLAIEKEKPAAERK